MQFLLNLPIVVLPRVVAIDGRHVVVASTSELLVLSLDHTSTHEAVPKTEPTMGVAAAASTMGGVDTGVLRSTMSGVAAAASRCDGDAPVDNGSAWILEPCAPPCAAGPLWDDDSDTSCRVAYWPRGARR